MSDVWHDGGATGIKLPYCAHTHLSFSHQQLMCCCFSITKFPTSYRPEGDLGQGGGGASCPHHDDHECSQQTDSLVLSHDVGLPASPVSSLCISVTPLASSYNELRMHPIQTTSWKCVSRTSTLKSTEAF